MSANQITEVTSRSWFGRIGGAIKGVLAGAVLFAAAFPLLFWNEGRTVKRYRTLKEGSAAVVSVAADKVDGANAGRLVHMTARAATDETLRDPVFAASAVALKLKRMAEMYQWKENSESKTRTKTGGGSETVTTYTYQKTWSDRVINSADFKEPNGHQNPAAMPYESAEQVANKVSLGAFALSPSLVGKINTFEPLPLPQDVEAPSGTANMKPFEGGFYMGANPGAPQVGDLRVKFSVVRPTDVSVMARQTGNTFEPYRTRAGGTIELLQAGIHTADAMIRKAQQENKLLGWLLRLGGFLLMLLGLNLIMRPLSVLASVLPFAGRIVGAGTGIIALLLAAMLSMTTIAIAWVAMRPLLAGALLAAGVVLAVAIVAAVKKAKR